MTLRARLVVGLAIIALALIVPLVIARNAMIDLHDQVTALQAGELKTSISLGSLRDAMADVRAREVVLGVKTADSAVYRQLLESIRVARGWADSVTTTFADSGSTVRIRKRLDQIVPIAQQEYAAYSANKITLGDTISQQLMGPAFSDAEQALKSIERQIGARVSNRVAATEVRIADAEQASLAGLVVAIVIAAVTGIWLMHSISGPVRALDRGMRAVAEGDLSHQLELSPQRRDEFGRLAISFQAMSQQLAELDKLKAEFVSVASHELKTPINVILGYLQLMQQGIYGPLSGKQTEILSTVEAQGRTLARLAAQLLDVTRFEAGGGRIEPRTLQLVALLEDLERAFHVLAVQRGIDFRLTMDEGLPDEVQWDPDRINEVMGNLLANAFKFTGSGGTVELTATPANDNVKIEVHDSGAGVPPDQLPHIFEKFYQANNQDAASMMGTGLGLAIAKEIVEAHRGQITCESVLGEGTTFTLLLPTEVHLRRHTGQHRAAELEAVS
jgi:signal transduction histidine kinase